MNLRFVIGLWVGMVCLFGQAPTATLTGRVSDASGAVIPAAALRLRSLDTNQIRNAASSGEGEYTIPFVPPGKYALEATAQGFRGYKNGAVELAVGQVLRIDVMLEVGAVGEAITVTDAAPVLNTESGTRGEVIGKEEISDIPLAGRNFNDLAFLTGGVIPKGDGGDGAFAVNGARADNTGFLLDGMNNTQRRNTGAVINPPIEGVQEFKMITSGFAAEYGRFAGGMLTVATKSGSNRFRGSLYEFVRNDVWDATGYFDVNRAKLRRNQFGATLSGPVIKDKTFFLFTWESLRLVDGKTQRGIVPRPEYLQGDFSRVTDAFGRPLTLVDPLNARRAFPGNQVPVSRLDPVALKLAAFYPAPNLGTSVNNYIAAGNGTTSNNNMGVKVDHNFSPKDRLTLSTFWRPNTSYDPIVSGRSPVPLFGLGNNSIDILSYARYLRTLTPSLYVELSANFSRKTNNQRWPLSEERDWGAEVGFVGGTQNPASRGLPQLDVAGYIPLGPAYDYPKVWSFNNFQYAGSTTWIKGKHTVKFGADFLRMQYFSRNFGDTRGRLTFLGRYTNEPMADVLLGWPTSTRRQLDAAGPYHLISNYSGFVQDDFKVSRSLTLNIGLRYELMKPPQEKFGAWSMFVPELGKIVISGKGVLSNFDQLISSSAIANSVVMAEAAGLPRTITQTDRNDFAPRFGFAWRPFKGNRSVIRGGYGIFYGSSSIYRLDEFGDTYPFSINESYQGVTNDPTVVTVSNPFPASRRSVGGITNTNGQQNKPQSQYLQSWNLTVEHEFAKDTVLEVAYAGSKGTHLQRRYDLNQQLRGVPGNPRPYPSFATINFINDGSNSSYNSGAVTLRRRFNRSFFVRLAYTYSKSIDESSNTGGTVAYNFAAAQDSRNLKGERGRSDFDIGHAFTGSFIFQPRLSKQVALRNWQISGTTTLYTGPPFTPRVANFNYLNGEASRPDRVGKGTIENPSVEQWFDRRQFPVVPVGGFRFGSSGRNILDGPGTFNLNSSLSRRFKIAETWAAQFRFESFNVLNRPNFNLPENRVDIISGGLIQRAKDQRVLQMGMRLEF
jgi:hypothetical protein